MRSVITNPFQYAGKIISFRLNYDERDLVKSWDIIYKGYLVNQANEETQMQLGFDAADLEELNTYAEVLVASQEGRILGNETYA